MLRLHVHIHPQLLSSDHPLPMQSLKPQEGTVELPVDSLKGASGHGLEEAQG